MSGIYIHIPFCKKRCFYCDFYSSVKFNYKDNFLKSLTKEFYLRKNYLSNNKIETIYIGGGTPSVLIEGEINIIFENIEKYFDISKTAEITLEANPDDLNNKYIQSLKKTPINRLSVGIQSFFDDDLLMMNRRHNSLEAVDTIKRLFDKGFTNISGDLIYGLPKMTFNKWQENLNIFFDLNIPHLSAYHIGYEIGTKFYNQKKKGKLIPVSENKSKSLFYLLINETERKNFIHYEISNFAKKGYRARHNSSYWEQKNYIGFGPSAHSYNGNSRQWNTANLKKYINNINKNDIFWDSEILNKTAKYNDYIITAIRTKKGIETDYIKNNFGEKFFNYFIKNSTDYIKSEHFIRKNNVLRLSKKGMFVADMISERLIII